MPDGKSISPHATPWVRVNVVEYLFWSYRNFVGTGFFRNREILHRFGKILPGMDMCEFKDRDQTLHCCSLMIRSLPIHTPITLFFETTRSEKNAICQQNTKMLGSNIR
jgi:hypothetical protein